MFNWLATMPLCHFGVLDPKYMRYEYTGMARASYLVAIANGTYTDRNKVREINSSILIFTYTFFNNKLKF